MGSAVNKTNIDKQLDDFSRVGIGGVNIIPIYGVKGFEKQFLSFLSNEWLEMVEYTIQKAEQLNLGVDISLGTGWPYGGRWFTTEYSAKKWLLKILY